jgi:hypothetical protein
MNETVLIRVNDQNPKTVRWVSNLGTNYLHNISSQTMEICEMARTHESSK